jgi:hypothetical protein
MGVRASSPLILGAAIVLSLTAAVAAIQPARRECGRARADAHPAERITSVGSRGGAPGGAITEDA